MAKNEFQYVDKWLSNEQINHKTCNYFWNAPIILDARITQRLNLDMHNIWGTTRKSYFGLTHPTPIIHNTQPTKEIHGYTSYPKAKTNA